MKIKAYANYGVLAAEKTTVYTIGGKHDQATASEEIELTLPDGWKMGENGAGEVLIESPEGHIWLANEIIGSYGNKPALKWFDGEYHKISLEFEPV